MNSSVWKPARELWFRPEREEGRGAESLVETHFEGGRRGRVPKSVHLIELPLISPEPQIYKLGNYL